MRAKRDASCQAAVSGGLEVESFRPVSARLERTTILTIILRARPQLMVRKFDRVNEVRQFRRLNVRRVSCRQDRLTAYLVTVNQCSCLIHRGAFIARRGVGVCHRIIASNRFLFLYLVTR